MWITAREAARRLESLGLVRRQALRALDCGLAGTAQVTTAARLYDEARVDELCARTDVDPDRLDRACPWGLLVARRDVRVGSAPDEQRAAVRDGWAFSPYLAILLRTRAERHGWFPMVATVAGFVVLGAELVDVRQHALDDAGRPRWRLVLQEPSGWFDELRGRRLPTGPGRPWTTLGVGHFGTTYAPSRTPCQEIV